MDFKAKVDNQKLEEMFANLTSISKQLALLQGFMESKFGTEFSTFCQLSSQSDSSATPYESPCHRSSMQDDSEEYDKMPNLVSQESPSRTLGYVTVPLRQTPSTSASGNGSKSQSSHSAAGTSRRDRGSVIKEEIANDNEDIMYPLHNFSDLLVESAEEREANETPEFLELELDPSTLLRGEPPSLQPMFADSNGSGELQGVTSNNHSGANSLGSYSKRNNLPRQTNSNNNNSNHGNNNFHHRYEMDTSSGSGMNRASGGSNNNISRRASVGNHDNNLSHKKFECLICGIKFEFAETLKSHMDSHTGSRNIRSNSEDQSGIGGNSNAPPLPKLMPRPAIPITPDISTEESSPVTMKSTRSKKSSSSSSSSGSRLSASAKRKRSYNSSRPCSLVCPECGLKIRDKSRLIEHLRGHTGERPFQCRFCDKSYTRKDVLKTHMVKMHGESPQI